MGQQSQMVLIYLVGNNTGHLGNQQSFWMVGNEGWSTRECPGQQISPVPRNPTASGVVLLPKFILKSSFLLHLAEEKFSMLSRTSV